jgi:hypothetical protein
MSVSDDVATAAAAVRSVDVGAGAFGVLCAFLVPPAGAAASMAHDAIRAAEAMIERSARELRQAAAELGAYEHDVVQSVAALSDRIAP